MQSEKSRLVTTHDQQPEPQQPVRGSGAANEQQMCRLTWLFLRSIFTCVHVCVCQEPLHNAQRRIKSLLQSRKTWEQETKGKMV